MRTKHGWPVSLMQVWPVDSPDSPKHKVYLCGEFANGSRIWPFKGDVDSPEGNKALEEYGSFEVESTVPAGFVQYIYLNMERKLPKPMTGEQVTLF